MNLITLCKYEEYNPMGTTKGTGKGTGIEKEINELRHELSLIHISSKEILEQNFKKLCSYGILDCSIYSASFNSKEISRITFATIGSKMCIRDRWYIYPFSRRRTFDSVDGDRGRTKQISYLKQ